MSSVHRAKALALSALLVLILSCFQTAPEPADFAGGWTVTGGGRGLLIITVTAGGIDWEEPQGIFPATLEAGQLRVPALEAVAELAFGGRRLLVTRPAAGRLDYERVPAKSIRETMERGHAQLTTVAMRTTGTAIVSWMTDVVTEPVADPEGVMRPVSVEELRSLLVPRYAPEVPAADAWGNLFEYSLSVDNVRTPPMARIRSGGPDGALAAESDNIEWVDGLFTRQPG